MRTGSTAFFEILGDDEAKPSANRRKRQQAKQAKSLSPLSQGRGFFYNTTFLLKHQA
jgi:hypothetical protein